MQQEFVLEVSGAILCDPRSSGSGWGWVRHGCDESWHRQKTVSWDVCEEGTQGSFVPGTTDWQWHTQADSPAVVRTWHESEITLLTAVCVCVCVCVCLWGCGPSEGPRSFTEGLVALLRPFPHPGVMELLSIILLKSLLAAMATFLPLLIRIILCWESLFPFIYQLSASICEKKLLSAIQIKQPQSIKDWQKTLTSGFCKVLPWVKKKKQQVQKTPNVRVCHRSQALARNACFGRWSRAVPKKSVLEV